METNLEKGRFWIETYGAIYIYTLPYLGYNNTLGHLPYLNWALRFLEFRRLSEAT